MATLMQRIQIERMRRLTETRYVDTLEGGTIEVGYKPASASGELVTLTTTDGVGRRTLVLLNDSQLGELYGKLQEIYDHKSRG